MTARDALDDADRMARLSRIAAAVGRSAPCRKTGWPSLWLFTDPDRTPDVLAAAALLPRGSGVVLRTFGWPHVEAEAAPLRRLTRERGLVLLVGADERLAAFCRADGLHLPERAGVELPRLRARRPGWRFTQAVHSARALRLATARGADAVFLSPVLASASPSAGETLGSVRVSALTRRAAIPVYGLGGVNVETGRRLIGSGLAGLAGVGFAQSRRA